MNDLVIEKTTQTPQIIFQKSGELLMSGVSTLSYAQKFYDPLNTWLMEYKGLTPNKINLRLEIYYLNTSSSLMFVELLRTINSFKLEGTEIDITWCYEEDDEDILNFGHELERVTTSKFKYVIVGE